MKLFHFVPVTAVCVSVVAGSLFSPVFGADAAAPATSAATQASSAREADPQVVKSTIYLLKNSLQVTPDGRHNIWINALRKLKDPRLEPLFADLAESDQRSLKIHGILGQAECRPDKKFDLLTLAQIDNPIIQEDAVAALMANKLISDEQAMELLSWPKMGAGAKLSIAVELVSRGKLKSKDALLELAKSQTLLQKAVADLLLLQMGDETGAKDLDDLSKSTDVKRDASRDAIMRISLRYQLNKIGPWAFRMAGEPGLSSRLARGALQVSMRFGVPGALDMWLKQYNADTDPASRTRLALMALQCLPDADPKYFEPLAASEDPIIKQIGLVGKAVISKTDIAQTIVGLANMHHGIADGWIMVYCEKTATLDDANQILAALVKSLPVASDSFRSEALDYAIASAQLISDQNPDAGAATLKPIALDPKVDPVVLQAIVMGLIASKNPDAYKVVDGLPITQSPATNSLIALLLAKDHRPLDDDQFTNLGVFAQGGSSNTINSVSLRLVAGWYYLTLTNRVDDALAQVVGK